MKTEKINSEDYPGKAGLRRLKEMARSLSIKLPKGTYTRGYLIEKINKALQKSAK